MKKILLIVGTRPNFIKITQFKKHAASLNFDLRIVHTGQHYDQNLSDIFFTQLDITPDYFLNVEKADSEKQIQEIKVKLIDLINTTFFPELVMVVGDVNSTRAAAETADILKIKIAHIESGLRSFDLSMPEENNRIITDKLSTYYFTTEQSAINNLLTEGFSAENIYFTGNTMIDTLMHYDKQITSDNILTDLHLVDNNYALVTIHRPSNVDSKEGLNFSLELLQSINEKYPIVFSIHPRTKNKFVEFGLMDQLNSLKNIMITPPLPYFAFQKLISSCIFIVTDSGGIQEEATFRIKPCITIRPNTERPITIDIGTNTLINRNLEKIMQVISTIENKTYKKGSIPALWDGKSTERIFQVLSEVL